MRYDKLLFLFLITFPFVCRGDEDIVAVRIDFNNPIFSRLDEDGKNVLREYAKVYPKIKKFYGNIRMDVTEKTYRTTADKNFLTYVPLNSPPILEREELFEVRYNTRDGDTRDGGFARVDSQIRFLLVEGIGGIFFGQNAPLKMNHPRRMTLITPEAGYDLSKKNSDNPFYSLTMKRNHDRYMESIGVKVLEFAIAPFSVGPMEMENLVFKPPFFAKDDYFVTSARYQDKQIVEIKICIDAPPRSNEWVVRLSRENWVIQDTFEQGWTVGGKNWWKRRRCVYNGEFEGMPLLSSYQQDNGVYNTDAKLEGIVHQFRYDVTKIVPGPVDISEFDVAQFLPPNVKIGEVMEPAQFSAARIAAIVIGIILIIWGVYMKIRNRNT